MKNQIKQIDKLLKEDDLDPKMKEDLKRKKELLSKDKKVEK